MTTSAVGLVLPGATQDKITLTIIDTNIIFNPWDITPIKDHIKRLEKLNVMFDKDRTAMKTAISTNIENINDDMSTLNILGIK